jgi:hypothetical protein
VKARRSAGIVNTNNGSRGVLGVAGAGGGGAMANPTRWAGATRVFLG